MANTNLDKIREMFTGLITADNTDVMTQIDNELKEVEKQYEKLSQENLTLKNKIVDMAKATTFTKAPEDVNLPPDKPLSLDEAFNRAVQQFSK